MGKRSENRFFMMNTKKLIIKIVLLTVFVCFNLLHADIQTSPNFLFLESPHRSTPLIVTNTGADEREVWVEIKFGYETTNDSGRLFIFIDSLGNSELSAASWVQGFPRRFILGGGESQTVRLFVTPPSGLTDGEYWARIIVTSKPTKKPQSAESAPTGVRQGINILYQLSLPFHYRVGKLTTGIIVNSLNAEIADTSINLSMNLSKTGNAAYWGSRTIRVIDKSGKTVLTKTKNTGVYTTLATLDRIGRGGILPGQYTVEVEFVTEKRMDVNKTKLVRSNPIHTSTTLIIP